MAKHANREKVCVEVVRLLVEERKRQGISGNALAEKSGLSQSLISSLETSAWNPTLDTLLRIADVLGVELGEILSKARLTVVKERP